MAKYIPRHIEAAIQAQSYAYPVVLVTGARQVGKTTLLGSLYSDLPMEHLDDPSISLRAKEDPKALFESFKPPLILDEVQNTPELLPLIKIWSDKHAVQGAFFLTGSQHYLMMQRVTETLAGRVSIMQVLGLSLRETSRDDETRPFVPEPGFLADRSSAAKAIDYRALWERVWLGSYPRLHNGVPIDWDHFYSNYVQTYIERDVSSLAQVGDRAKFFKFMRMLASMTGCLLNKSSLANAVDISVSTVERWLSILEATHLILLLLPYHTTTKRRLTKTPKIHFMDTGLACWLSGWSNPDVLERSPAAGSFFESFVVGEIVKSHTYAKGLFPRNLYFYRDGAKHEIDLLIEHDGCLYPIEIKRSTIARLDDTGDFRYLDGLSSIARGPGAVICLTDRLNRLGEDNWSLPPWMI